MELRRLIQRSQVLKPLKNNRGMAMIMAVSTMALIIYLAVEIMYDTTVEYNVNAQELNRLKSYYAARGAVEIGLLRIKIYQSVKNKLGDQLQGSPYAPYIDQIWSFPIQWPLPTELLNAVDKDTSEEKKKESLVDAQYTLDIADEGSKIDINDLVSPSETLRKNAERMLLSIFEERIKTDDQFRKEYGQFHFEDLIEAMRDFMSSTWNGKNGDKRSQYSEFQSQELPPNRGFRTVGELHLIPLMDDNLFEMLEPRITIYGLKGVNPNTASSESLQSLDPGLTKEVAQSVLQERQKNPFTTADSFFAFASEKSGQKLKARKSDEWPITFDSMTSFRVTAHGVYQNTSREITAIVMDISQTSARIKTFVDKDKPKDPLPAGGSPKTAPPKKPPERLSKGPPRVVYWSEN